MTKLTSRCRYCLETKPLEAFNRGHVIPQAFGKFEDNLVLHGIECETCNKFSGDELERVLARDSKEGLDRFEHGLVKPRKDGRRLGKRISFTAQGRFEGASYEIDPDAPSDQIRLRPVRELGFGPSWDGPFKWYRLEDVPSAEELRSQGLFVSVAGSMPAEEVDAFLKERGIEVEETRTLGDPRGPDGKLPATLHGRIDQTLMRAIAKIAFSYFTHEYPGPSLMPEFNEIRRFIREGTEPSFEPVKISTKSIIGGLPKDAQLLAHIVTVRWDSRDHRVFAQVSLFDWLQYQVTLSTARFLIPPNFIDSGHAFNIYAKQTAKLTRNRRLARPFWLMTKDEFAQWKTENSGPNSATRSVP